MKSNTLTGQTFGDWQVIKRAQRNGEEVYYWCRCQCGTEKAVSAKALKRGSSTSCGCRRRLNTQAGDRFGRWTVLDMTFTETSHRIATVRCDCGTEKKLLLSNLIRGNSLSCGCIGREESLQKVTAEVLKCESCQQMRQVSDFFVRVQNGRPLIVTAQCRPCRKAMDYQRYRSDMPTRMRSLVAAAKSRAKKGGLPFDLDIEWAEAQLLTQGGRCYYTGRELNLDTGRFALSIDKKDPAQGYTKTNSVWCCWCANEMKRDLTEAEFIAICGEIVQRRRTG